MSGPLRIDSTAETLDSHYSGRKFPACDKSPDVGCDDNNFCGALDPLPERHTINGVAGGESAQLAHATLRVPRLYIRR